MQRKFRSFLKHFFEWQYTGTLFPIFWCAGVFMAASSHSALANICFTASAIWGLGFWFTAKVYQKLKTILKFIFTAMLILAFFSSIEISSTIQKESVEKDVYNNLDIQIKPSSSPDPFKSIIKIKNNSKSKISCEGIDFTYNRVDNIVTVFSNCMFVVSKNSHQILESGGDELTDFNLQKTELFSNFPKNIDISIIFYYKLYSPGSRIQYKIKRYVARFDKDNYQWDGQPSEITDKDFEKMINFILASKEKE